MIAALTASTGAALGATITVNYDTDAIANDGLCTLVEAITAVNTQTPSGDKPGECPAGDPGPNTIVLDADNTFGPVTPVETTGYTIDSGVDLTITGAGSDPASQNFTSIDASEVTDRVFQVDAGATLKLQDLEVLDGNPPADEDGGGILNHGSLTLDGARVADNATGNGGNGAGIANTGSLTLVNSTVTGNVAGRTGSGGGIYNTGTLTLTDSSVTQNHSGAGGYNGIGIFSAGAGGGISSAGGTVTVLRSTVSGNVTGDGADAPFVHSGDGFLGGFGGDGGGIFNAGPSTLIVTDSTVSNNQTGAGGAGGDTQDASNAGIGGRGGDGGGIDSAGAVTITGSTISGNSTGNGAIGADNASLQPSVGGRGGQGAGINAGSSLQATNVTITGNTTGSGGLGGNDGGSAFFASGGAGGGGGAVAQTAGNGVILNATIAGNTVGVGGAGTLGIDNAPSGADGAGAGLLQTGGELTLTNSIVTAGSGSGCSGTITDGGHNLRFPLADTSCPGTGGDPALGQLKDNGGDTQTMALGPTSAAFDKVPATGSQCPATDQRGTPRPQGAACDIGAFEATAAVVGATPGFLTFPAQSVGTASAPQTVSVADTGEAPAVVSGVTISGADAGDFTISTNGCQSQTINSGASCSVSVAFKPTAAGTRTASLAITDEAGIQTVALSGTGTSGGGTEPAPKARLVSAKVAGTHATITIACGSGSGQCSVGAALTVTEHLRGRKLVAVTAAKSTKVKKRIVTLATRTASIDANATGTIVLKLSKAGTRLLAARHQLKATLTVTQHGASGSVKIAKRALKFKAAKKKHSHR